MLLKLLRTRYLQGKFWTASWQPRDYDLWAINRGRNAVMVSVGPFAGWLWLSREWWM